MTFNRKEKLVISLLLGFLYLIPASLEWLQHADGHFPIIVISLPIWLVFFYIGPFWLFYLLQKTTFVSGLNVFMQGAIYVIIMYTGAYLVGALHMLAFPHYRFSAAEQLASAILWGVFIFSMAQMYLLYWRLVLEQKLRKETQWLNLTNRLNPHFLFNSLNTISALIYTSPQKADEVLHKLADILRYSVEQQNQWVALEDELTICRTYLSIEQARFTDSLVINWQMDKALNPTLYKVPPMLLQPLIENVVKHVKTRPIVLDITIGLNDHYLIFLIQDNGKGFAEPVLSEKKQHGHGLDIVKKRVALVGGTLALYNQGGAVCKISLPIHHCG